ncbi:hypothetical protein M378DRAFT_161958 [Amanita muscaria Koide BX008]|uniref:Uncharacterized protein n=1 Tax=Amanita muscaria (strain Koide BX008) TaxID=946122 RepID=A0A0C2XA39_AMAMK|nr:hypothetical protein M378DRAFT_161958 [Amanita muscaria Koide BX008]
MSSSGPSSFSSGASGRSVSSASKFLVAFHHWLSLTAILWQILFCFHPLCRR